MCFSVTAKLSVRVSFKVLKSIVSTERTDFNSEFIASEAVSS